MKVILSDESTKYFITNCDRYAMKTEDKLIRYFFPDNVLELPNTTLHIYGIQLHDMNILDEKNNINVLICIENCAQHQHYKHYKRFGDFGNDKIHIYFYNHIDRCIVTDTYIAIPVIYSQIRYFSQYYETIAPTIYTPTEQKRFCLFATSPENYMRKEKMQIMSFLSSMGECHDIRGYAHIIGDKSCYHSIELLNVLNKYKFVFVSENSIGDGYITEKIFNCFFARTIPVYYGSKKISRYINPRAFIEIDTHDLAEVRHRITNATDDMLLEPKIADTYNDENYDVLLKSFIERL